MALAAVGENMIKILLFLLTCFFGWSGLYRFLRGQILLGLLYLFTFGLFYIGWLVDSVCAFRDMIKKPVPRSAAPALQAPPPDPFHAPRPDTNADELLKYKRLLDSGAITREEYERKKVELLDPNSPAHKYVTCAYCGTRNLRGAPKCTACGAKLD